MATTDSGSRLTTVLRSIALLSGGFALEACRSAEAQQLAPRPDRRVTFALRACPAVAPAQGARCTAIVGTARGSAGCRYADKFCECRGNTRADAVFVCVPHARSHPNRGPLPPPELAATV